MTNRVHQLAIAFLLLGPWAWGQDIQVEKPKSAPSPTPARKVTPKRPTKPEAKGTQENPKAPEAPGPQASREAFPTHFFGVSRETAGERKSWVYEAELRPLKMDPKDVQALALSTKMAPSVASQLRAFVMFGRKGIVPKGGFEPYNFYILQGPGFIRGAYLPSAFALSRTAIANAEWVSPEMQGETFVFPTPNLTVKLTPTNVEFVAKEFQALGFAGAALVKMRSERGVSTDNPYSLDGVLCLAMDGKNQYRGLFKFPLWTVVVPLRGYKVGEEIWLEGEHEDSMMGYWNMSSGNESVGRTSGLWKLDEYKTTLRVKILAKAIQLSFSYEAGREPRWTEDLHDWSRLSAEAQRENFKPLEGLQASYQAHFGQRLWETSDESNSFSDEADRAFVGAGLPVGLPVFYQASPDASDARSSVKLSARLKARIQELGATTRPMRLPFLKR